MRLDEILVGKVDARWGDRAGDHLLSVAEEMVVVSIAIGREGEHQRGSPAASGAPAALRVIRGRWRDVAKMNSDEVTDVDTQLHGRRAEEDRQFACFEFILALDPKVCRHLAGMFGRG
jgi:hypothetical protein